jgi:hypothetical protein
MECGFALHDESERPVGAFGESFFVGMLSRGDAPG